MVTDATLAKGFAIVIVIVTVILWCQLPCTAVCFQVENLLLCMHAYLYITLSMQCMMYIVCSLYSFKFTGNATQCSGVFRTVSAAVTVSAAGAQQSSTAERM